MLPQIIKVKPLGDYRLWLEFKDGVSGEVDLSKIIEFKGYYFTALKNKTYFRRVRLLDGWGTIEWPNNADIDPGLLYAAITGKRTEYDAGSSQAPKYTNQMLEKLKRAGLVTEVIDSTITVILAKKPNFELDELIRMICQMLPWSDPRTVMRRAKNLSTKLLSTRNGHSKNDRTILVETVVG